MGAGGRRGPPRSCTPAVTTVPRRRLRQIPHQASSQSLELELLLRLRNGHPTCCGPISGTTHSRGSTTMSLCRHGLEGLARASMAASLASLMVLAENVSICQRVVARAPQGRISARLSRPKWLHEGLVRRCATSARGCKAPPEPGGRQCGRWGLHPARSRTLQSGDPALAWPHPCGPGGRTARPWRSRYRKRASACCSTFPLPSSSPALCETPIQPPSTCLRPQTAPALIPCTSARSSGRVVRTLSILPTAFRASPTLPRSMRAARKGSENGRRRTTESGARMDLEHHYRSPADRFGFGVAPQKRREPRRGCSAEAQRMRGRFYPGKQLPAKGRLRLHSVLRVRL